MYYKKTILIFLCCLMGSLVKGQELSPEVTQYNPVSPNSASLGKFGAFPASNNLGTINVAVPLLTVDTGKQQMPIGLSYNTGGIKVNDLASWVGLGWTLNAGGAIIRNVKGKPDNFLNQGIVDLENALFLEDNFFYIYDCWKGIEDSQPDEFILNAPGISGTFQFDSNQNGMVVFDGREIARVSVNGVDKMEVIGPDGTKMIFGKSTIEENNQFHDATESSWHSPAVQANGFEYISAWYLTEMIAPKAKDTIKLRYTENISHTYPEATGDASDASMTPSIRGSYPGAYLTYQKVLSRIEFSNGYILFISANDRSDLDTEPRLVKVEVYAGEFEDPAASKINEFVFNYGYFTRQGGIYPVGAPVNSSYEIEWSQTFAMRLDSIVVGNNGIGGSYSFAYNGTALPLRGTTAQDQWGYANGNTGSFVPRTTGFYYLNQASSVEYDVGNGNRKSDPVLMKAASLERITYPTGGYSIFELEPHQRTYQTTSSTVVQSPPNSTIAYGPECEGSSGPSLVIKNITIPNNVIGKVKLGVNFSTANSGGTGAYVDFNGVKYQASGGEGGEELNGGSREYSFNLSPGTYTLIVSDQRTGNPSGAASSCPFTWATLTWNIPGPDVSEEVTEYFGGLKLKSIKNYDGVQSEPISQKNFEYSFMNILRPFRELGYKKYYLTDWPSPNVRLQVSSAEYFNNNLDNRPVVEYQNVIEYDVDNAGNNIGKTEYVYDLVSSQRILTPGVNGIIPFQSPNNTGNNTFYNLKQVMVDDDFSYYRSDGWRYGKLEHKYVYKNTGTLANPNYILLQQIDNTYDELEGPEIKSNYIFANIPSPSLFDGQYQGSFNLPYNEANDAASFIFSYYVAKKPTGKKVLNNSTVTNYDETGSNGVATHTEYFYENTKHLLPTRTVTTDSRGKTFITKTYFPDDVGATGLPNGPILNGFEEDAIDDLKTTGLSHRIAEPIQVEAYQDKDKDGVADDDEVLSISRTNYQDWDPSIGTSLVLPTGVMTLKGEYNSTSNLMEPRVVYHGYDALGNPIDVSKVDGPHTYYVWGYQRQYPIAKIENLEKEDIDLDPQIQILIDAAVVASNSDDDTCLDSVVGICKERDLRTALNNLRAYLPSKALMTSYTYNVLVGVSSSTDPKGYTMYYEYDAFNRLKAVKDYEGNFIEDYDYHYTTQP